MMCQECKDAAAYNRGLWDSAEPTDINAFYWEHPTDCDCTCMHKDTGQWEKQFGVKQPETDHEQ